MDFTWENHDRDAVPQFSVGVNDMDVITWMMVQAKNINLFKKSTDKQFNDWAIIDYQGKMVCLSLLELRNPNYGTLLLSSPVTGKLGAPWRSSLGATPVSVLCARVLSCFSCRVRLFVTLWTLWSCGPGSSVHGILQARILEWVAMHSSRGFSQPRHRTCISYVSCIGRQVLTLLGKKGLCRYNQSYYSVTLRNGD